VGHVVADLATGDGGVRGGAVALDWRGPGHAHLLMSASAVTGRIRPGYGWTRDGERLLVNAISWLREAEQPLPATPALEADELLVAAEVVTVRGTAEFRSTVTVLRDGEPVATAEPARDGAWSDEAPLAEGANTLVAVASNFAGDSEPSAPVTAVRDTLGPVLDWMPADGTAFLDPLVAVAGTATDPSGTALVEVGGVVAELDGSGAWRADVALAGGANTIVVRAVDVLGNETVEERAFAYLPYDVTWRAPPQASARGVTPVRLTVGTTTARWSCSTRRPVWCSPRTAPRSPASRSDHPGPGTPTSSGACRRARTPCPPNWRSAAGGCSSKTRRCACADA
jgi:hypothetical protein